jgi:hypothetical protein
MDQFNPVKEMLEGCYFYESTSVSCTRKDKSCSLCSNTIPRGSAHTGAKLFCDEYFQVDFCNDCVERYKTELAAMKNQEYDTY